MKVLFTIAFIIALLPQLALSDMGPPVHMQITESEPDFYSAQWRVPRILLPRAVPSPQFPETCQPANEGTVLNQPGAWLFRQDWICETTLAGQEVGMYYPFPDLALTTVIRADLLSGDRFAHVLSPGDGPWRLPEGTAAPDPLLGARRALMSGLSHVLTSWIHLVFLLILSLMGGYRQPVRLVTGFTVGQLAGTVLAGLATGIGAVLAEIVFAAGVIVLARHALEPTAERRGLQAITIAAGFAHGAGITALLALDSVTEGGGLFGPVFAILGMDSAHLAGALALTWLWSLAARWPVQERVRQAALYCLGAIGLALAIGLAFTTESVERLELKVPAGSEVRSSSGIAGSQRLAPSTPNATIQSFVAVEPFEIRHEVMLRLAGLSEELGLDTNSTIEIENQSELCERLAALVLQNTRLEVDGQSPAPQVRRVDFMTVDPTGALPRPNPVQERMSEAVVGVILNYPTDGMPQGLTLLWSQLPKSVSVVPTTMIDPEKVTVQAVSAQIPSVEWENTLLEDPIPAVHAVEVEPLKLPIPWLSLPMLLAVAMMVFAESKGNRPGFYYAWARIVLALAVLVGPVTQTTFALPGSEGRTPSERQARRILSGLLPNIYRAMEFRDEAAIYDRLAISITGDTLSQVYLGQRKVLEIEERGGAQARVQTVEVLATDGILSREEGFGVRAEWTVSGMVTHFGHRHFRQNRYNAWIEIVPLTETWKIRSIEVLEQERVK